MVLNAYSIFDRKALVYHSPFFTSTDGAATRMVLDAVNDSNTGFSRHPADYVLFRVGTWDDSNGGMQPVSPLVHVVDLVALVTTQLGLPLAAQ